MEWSGRAPAPSAIEAGNGRQRRGARYVPQSQQRSCRNRYRYRQELHVVGLDSRGAIVLRQKWSRGQIEARLANMPPRLIGMEACVGAHHLSRKLGTLGHDARLMPAKYVRPYSKGQKNDFRDAEAIAEAVQRPTMKFVATKTAEQLDLQALHRVRERLVSQRTGIINQIRAFLLERGIAVRQGLRFLRVELPRLLATPNSAKMVMPASVGPFVRSRMSDGLNRHDEAASPNEAWERRAVSNLAIMFARRSSPRCPVQADRLWLVHPLAGGTITGLDHESLRLFCRHRLWGSAHVLFNQQI